MDWTVVVERGPDLARGLGQTLVLCAAAAVAALLVGAILTWIQLRAKGVLRWAADVYTAVCLGAPLLIVIYILFFALPEYGVTLSPHTVGVLALALYYAPYFAQVLAGAIRAIPTGQWQAAKALGMRDWQGARHVVLPQALPVALPPATGLLIGLLKDSALLAVVSVPEFMFAAKQAIADTYAPLEIYVTVAVVYWILSMSCAAAADLLERRLSSFRSIAGQR
jgi:His/Glu/Gln/Arg/opine family amino acid ABC transporter permease subunit